MDNNWKNGDSSLSLKYKNGIKKLGFDLLISFFCKTTGVKSQPIDLPITHPFYLLPYGSAECQQVKWMVATSEWIQYGTLNYQGQTRWKGGAIPYTNRGSKSHKGLTMFYCYYESCNKTLTDMKGTFQSPRFPDKYPDGQLCSWKIRIPANHTIYVYFTTFSLAVENGNDTDVLELYRSTNDSLELVQAYRGSLESFKVLSTSDLIFVFRSNQAISSSGFNAEYHIILDEASTSSIQPTLSTSAVRHPSLPSTTRSSTKVITQSSTPLPDDKKSTRTADNTSIIAGTVGGVVVLVVMVAILLIIKRKRNSATEMTDVTRVENTENNENNENNENSPDYSYADIEPASSGVPVYEVAADFTPESEEHHVYGTLEGHVPHVYGTLNSSNTAQPISRGCDDEDIISSSQKGSIYQQLNQDGRQPTYQSLNLYLEMI